MSVLDLFRIDRRAVVVTGAAGLLGRRHAETIAEMGGVPVLWDISVDAVAELADELRERFGGKVHWQAVDVTDGSAVEAAVEKLVAENYDLYGLINNAANNPKVEPGEDLAKFRLENFPPEVWERDIAVGLTGAMNCARVLGPRFLARGGGVILNIASDLGVMAPDQRLYRRDGRTEDQQPVKPVSYSVVKHGLIGLTRYLATYWADGGVRANAIAPGGVQVDQDREFLDRIEQLIPMGRMARDDEYKGIVAFLCSDASSYMNGAIINVDGGRSTW